MQQEVADLQAREAVGRPAPGAVTVVMDIGAEDLEFDGVTFLIDHRSEHRIAEMLGLGPTVRQLVEGHVMRSYESGPADFLVICRRTGGHRASDGQDECSK